MTGFDEKKEVSDRQIAAVPKGRMIILGGEGNELVDIRSTPNRVQGSRPQVLISLSALSDGMAEGSWPFPW